MENSEDRSSSPVLSNINNRRAILNKKLRKKSRVKLSDRFNSNDSQNSLSNLSNQENTSTYIEQKELKDEMTSIYSAINLTKDVFKKPESKFNVELSIDKKNCFGFQTANGKKIEFSESIIKKHTTMFDDILNPTQVNLHKNRTNKYSFLRKNSNESPKETNLQLVDVTHCSGDKNDTFANITVIENEIVKNIEENYDIECGFKGFNVDEAGESKLNALNHQKWNLYQINKRSNLHLDKSEQNPKRIKTVLNNNPLDSIDSNNFDGFFSSGKSKVSEDDLKKANKLYQNITLDEIEEMDSKKDNVLLGEKENNGTSIEHTIIKKKNPQIFESGRESVLKNANRINENIKLSENEEHVTLNNEKPSNFVGFLTAFGSKINLSELALKKATQMFNNITPNEINAQDKNRHLNNKNESTLVKGLKTNICGNSVQRPKSLLSKGNHSCKDDIVKISENIKDINKLEPNNSAIGFSSALGNKIEFSEISVRKANTIFVEISKEHNAFASASGNSIKLTECALNKANRIFKNFNNDINITENKESSAHLSCTYENREKTSEFDSKKLNQFVNAEVTLTEDSNVPISKSVGFASASGGYIKVSESALKNAQQMFNEQNFEDESKSIIPTVPIKKSNINFDYKDEIEGISVFTEPNANIGNNKFPNCSTENKRQENRNSFLNKSIKKKTLGISRSKSIQIAKEKLLRAQQLFDGETNVKTVENGTPKKTIPTCSTPLKMNQGEFIMDLTITPIKCDTISNIVTTNKPNVLVLERKDDYESISKHFEEEKRLLENKLKIIRERQNALLIQNNLIENTYSEHNKRRPGVLYLKKQCTGRVTLQSCVTASDNAFNLQPITAQNAEFLNFKCLENVTSVVNTQDGAFIIPNAEDLIGLPEIELSFKSMPGIESKLIPKNWISNHYKWIVWKLASYEAFFLDFKNCLSVENVIQQLKYRYDREIDRVERPTLRKIFEKDDVPQKRMVLCVSDFFKLSDNKFELELTDGWYSIRTIIDEVLSVQCLKKKIRIGTKLITCGAELLNCEGCHPLDAIDAVRLKINGNSTRRVAWHAKLGYQQFPEPFPVMLKSIVPTGGLVGCVKVYIARVYPIKYLEKQGTLSVWRNEKAEEIRAQNWEHDRLKKIEEVREVVRMDYERSRQNIKKTNSNLNYSKSTIANITCPKTLFDLMTNSKDPDSLQELLNPSQIESLKEYHRQIVAKKECDLRLKMESSLNEQGFRKRDVTSVLQLQLVDVLDENVDKGVIFQIWRPTEAHLHTIKENSVFFIYNIIAKKNGNLSSMTRTKFKQISEDTSKFNKHRRITLPISSLVNNSYNMKQFEEFDTVGIIVDMSISTCDQILWLADFTGTLLVVKICNGPKNCALLDNLKPSQVVVVSNLLFSLRKKRFIEAIGNHSTIITSYPQQKDRQAEIYNFNEKLTKDVNEFVKDCLEKIRLYTDKLDDVKNISSRSLNTSTTLDDSLEEESTLNYSRITSTDIAMSLIDIDKFT